MPHKISEDGHDDKQISQEFALSHGHIIEIFKALGHQGDLEGLCFGFCHKVEEANTLNEMHIFEERLQRMDKIYRKSREEFFKKQAEKKDNNSQNYKERLEESNRNILSQGVSLSDSLEEFYSILKQNISLDSDVRAFCDGVILYHMGDLFIYDINEYEFCLMPPEIPDDKLQEGILYLKKIDDDGIERIAYTVKPPKGEIVRNKILYENDLKPPDPFTLSKLNPLKAKILKYTEDAGHTRGRDHVKHQLSPELRTAVRPFALSAKMERLGGTERIGGASGVYDTSSLMTYAEVLKKSLKGPPPITQPINFHLMSMSHAVIIGYDPNKQELTFTDIENLPAKKISLNEVDYYGKASLN